MKKLAVLAGSAALFAAAMVPAFAANTCENSTTGPFSMNTCSIFNTDTVNVKNVNDAQIVNNVSTNSNTGGNQASMNTLGGSITTGDASSNVTVSSVANVNTTKITSGLSSAAGNSGVNSITGPSSVNAITLTNTHAVNVDNENTATVRNNVNVQSDTGRNLANTNTGPAVISTGNASLGLAVLNHVNDNLTEVEGSAAGAGTNVAENSTTGPFSINTVGIFNTYAARVDNVNDLQVENNVNALANSGLNQAKTNTLGGDITTGDAGAGVGVETEGNINTTRIAMAMGGFDNYGVNSVTGPSPLPGADPAITIVNTRTVAVENLNNKCKSHNAKDREWRVDSKNCDVNDLGVFNNVNSLSDTGNNLGNTNTGGGGVVSGMAELLQQVLTHLNDTLTEIY